MKFDIKILFLILFPFWAFAQSETEPFMAVIQDKDGFTFVREKANKSSKVIDTLRVNDIFDCEKLENDWYKISSGYIHKSRVKPITKLSAIEKRSLVEYRLNVHEKNCRAVQDEIKKFKQSKSTAAKIEEKRAKRTNYAESSYYITQVLFGEYFIKTGDLQLLEKYLGLVYLDQGNRDQNHEVIASCFMEKNKIMVDVLHTYKGEKLEFLLRYIECGFYALGNSMEYVEDKPNPKNDEGLKSFMKYFTQLKTEFHRIKINSFSQTCVLP